MSRDEITDAQAREALEVMCDQFGTRVLMRMLKEIQQARMIEGFVSEGMSQTEAEEYAAELDQMKERTS